jgi:molybdate transport system regulatory protein
MKTDKTSGTVVPEFGIKHKIHLVRKPETGVVFRSKVWVEKDGKLLMGWGRATLLERIGEFGSISAAARSMKLSYRNAWLWVEAMNRLADKPLVEKVTGGVKGGNASLTDEGRRLIAEYKKMRGSVREITDK